MTATLFSLRKKGTERLEQAGIADAENDSFVLLCEVFGIDRTGYAMKSRDTISRDDGRIGEYEAFLNRRAGHEPLQYITGKADFMGYTFYVTPDVLIPRFDSETLIAEAAKEAEPGMRVLDLCTGSGCLLLSLMKEVPGISGTGTDISEKAIAVAKKNAELLEVKDVSWYAGDLFEALPERTAPFDMILSNPPYIQSEVIKGLAEEVKDHEPYLALDGGKDGLRFYRRILSDAGNCLRTGGVLLVETGYDETEDVRDLFCLNGFDDTAVLYDLGGNARVVRGRKI